MTGYAEDGGYFSPSLQDEVFQQVTTVPDSVLLHATHLDSIEVNKLCLQFAKTNANVVLCKRIVSSCYSTLISVDKENRILFFNY